MNIDDLTEILPVHRTKKPKKQSKIKKIIVHTTDGVVTAKGLAKYDIGPNHISKTGCPTITYHYLIHQSGAVNKTANHDVVTWHAGPHNPKSLAVALNYKTDAAFEKSMVRNGFAVANNKENLPSKKAMQSLKQLLVKLCLEEKITPTEVYGHRELKGTGWTLHKGSKRLRKTCPGMDVDLQLLRKNVVTGAQRELKQAGLYTGKIDGLWGQMSAGALARYVV